ncbi:hypothetical protein D6829_00745 [Candidatus Pacearchaeota archaeon]|nr:MAG: hypothetical protein D6829_00745 [Candidatus Pacearchaeota archaeon]
MLNPYEAKILTLLIKKHTFWNTSEVARAAKISWNTAEKYLEKMYKRGWLEKKGRAKLLWKAIINDED